MITRHNCLIREGGVSVNVCEFERTTLNRPDCQVCDYWQTDKTKIEEVKMAEEREKQKGVTPWEYRPQNYNLGLKCKDCGSPVSNTNKSGFCVPCSCRNAQKSSNANSKKSKQESETPTPKPETRRNPDKDILAIELVLADAKRWREIEPLISQIMAVAKQLQEIVA